MSELLTIVTTMCFCLVYAICKMKINHEAELEYWIIECNKLENELDKYKLKELINDNTKS